MKTNIIYNEDCMITMKRLPHKSIDMILTSPPYDNLRSYDSKFDYEAVLLKCFHILKDGGVAVFVIGDETRNGSETGTSFKLALAAMEIGFNLHDTMIYLKKNFLPQNYRRYEQCFEYMFVFVKGDLKTFNPNRVKCRTAGEGRGISKKVIDKKSNLRNFQTKNKLITKQEKTDKNVWEFSIGGSEPASKKHISTRPYSRKS